MVEPKFHVYAWIAISPLKFMFKSHRVFFYRQVLPFSLFSVLFFFFDRFWQCIMDMVKSISKSLHSSTLNTWHNRNEWNKVFMGFRRIQLLFSCSISAWAVFCIKEYFFVFFGWILHFLTTFSSAQMYWKECLCISTILFSLVWSISFVWNRISLMSNAHVLFSVFRTICHTSKIHNDDKNATRYRVLCTHCQVWARVWGHRYNDRNNTFFCQKLSHFTWHFHSVFV